MFLKKCGVIDYSLLVVIEKITANPSKGTFSDTRNSFVTSDFEFRIHIGVIDYLQAWNMKKKFESCSKRFFLSQLQISAVDPAAYQSRFMEFIRYRVMSELPTTFESEFMNSVMSTVNF